MEIEKKKKRAIAPYKNYTIDRCMTCGRIDRLQNHCFHCLERKRIWHESQTEYVEYLDSMRKHHKFFLHNGKNNIKLVVQQGVRDGMTDEEMSVLSGVEEWHIRYIRQNLE